MIKFFLVAAVFGLFWCGSVLGQEESSLDFSLQSPASDDIYVTLDSLGCPGVTEICLEVVPSLFVDAYPDSLLELLYYWEDTCGRDEPITRALVLGAIWDGAFDEDLYGDEIMDFLVQYSYPEEDGEDSYPTPTRVQYDAFTIDLADQLLPHVPVDSVEQFFCLFYSDRQDEAWDLLGSGKLEGSYLNRQFEWERERISLERKKTTIIATTGYWMPSGNLALAGDHPNVGLMAEMRKKSRFYRVAGDVLMGRADYPYTVDRPERRGRSDRFNAIALMLEGGVSPWRHESQLVDVYAGVGFEGMVAFLSTDDEDSVFLTNLKGLVGVGYRRFLGNSPRFFVGLDLRREWMTDRNEGGTPLDGSAWSFRFSFGLNPNYELDRRLQSLGP